MEKVNETSETRLNILDNKIDAKTAELLAIIQVSHPLPSVNTTWFEYVRVWFWIKQFFNSSPHLYLTVYFPLVYEYCKISFKKKEAFPYWFRIRFTKKCQMSLMKLRQVRAERPTPHEPKQAAKNLCFTSFFMK